MLYLVHKPSPPLDTFVENLWFLSDAPRHDRERIVPSGTLELVINLHEDELRIHGAGSSDGGHRFRGAIVSGCYRGPFAIDTRAHAAIIGVHFVPGAAGAVLGICPGALADTHVGLDDLWGRSAAELREQLCAERDPQRRFAMLEHALVARLHRDAAPRPAVRAALEDLEHSCVSVGEVAGRLGLSRRRLIEIFTEDVGMTPKVYSRVRRFQRALALATSRRNPAWAELACASGYYDQAHMCRDWAELAGLSPGELVAMRATPVKDNHVAVA